MHKKCTACMVLFGFLAVVCLLSGVSSALADTPPDETSPGRHPKIIFNEQSHDFGDQPPNASPRHRFTFNNTGGETLIIEKIKAG
jgi:hypothetical protein